MDLATVNVIAALALLSRNGEKAAERWLGRPHTAITRTTFWAASSVYLASRGTERYHLHRVEIEATLVFFFPRKPHHHTPTPTCGLASG